MLEQSHSEILYTLRTVKLESPNTKGR